MTDQIIEKLNIKNFMGIKQLNYIPQTNFIRLEGSNAAGKSSIEKAISVLFMSKEDVKLIKNPVRNGENMATVSAELTDMTISKSWNVAGKSRVEVLSKDGARYPSPTKLIEGLIGPLPHDPTRLMNQSDKEITETLLSLIGTDVDFKELEVQKKKTYDDRTLINRLKKATEVKRNGYDKYYSDAPDNEISVLKLSSQLTEALAIEDQHRIDIGLREDNRQAIATKQAQITQINQEIGELQNQSIDIETSIQNYEDPSTQTIKDQIESAEETNKQVRYMQEKAALVAEYTDLKEQSESKTQELQDIADTKEYAIKNANMPVEGISFDENGLTYNGVPLSQCSTGEQLIVCLSIAIGTHPKTEHGIKVMLLHHGNNLDKKALKYVKNYCAGHGYQTWIEIVADEPSGTGLFIEGGEIKNGD